MVSVAMLGSWDAWPLQRRMRKMLPVKAEMEAEMAERAAIFFDSSQNNIKITTGQSELGFTCINRTVKLFLIPV